MKRSLTLSGLLLLMSLVAPAFAQEASPAVSQDQERIDAAIARVYPSLARIHVVSERPRGGRMEKVAGTGSGTIIHEDGFIVTNHHVAGNATRVWVRLSNKEKIDAKVIGTDPQTDLCVIQLNMDQVPDSMKPLPVAEFGDFSTLEVGDTVLAMGSPAGVSQSVTLGVVANLEMIVPNGGGSLRQDGENVGDLVRWIGHDAVIYFGNSGGPLVNLNGEIIGVNEIGLGSLGGAIPADIAKFVTAELIENQRVRRSWSGVLPQPILRSQDDVGGILVGAVVD
ncbi:MAG: S1C family serine protease, partial [Verrucomicrobiales bacterium]